jgi:hypothetical protein
MVIVVRSSTSTAASAYRNGNINIDITGSLVASSSTNAGMANSTNFNIELATKSAAIARSISPNIANLASMFKS